MPGGNNVPRSNLDQVKRTLNVTWDDTDTDAKILDLMADAEEDLKHRLGAKDIDFYAAGSARRIFMAYMLYAWNNSLEEFDQAYRAEIIRLRHIFEVEADEEEGTV